MHCTRDFLNRQQSGPCTQDQYQACHWSCFVSLGGKTWISRCCLLYHRDIWTTATRSNIDAYSFRSQCCCCSYWPWVLLTCLLLSLQGSRITWLTGFPSPLWKDPDGSAWWLLTCPKGCLLVCVTKQLYFVTPPFQPEKAIPRTAQSSPERRALPSPPGSWRLGQRHQQKMWRGSGTVNLLTSELQTPAKDTWGCHNNPNPWHCQRSLPNCNSGDTQ